MVTHTMKSAISVDIETLGKGPYAVILSIGAVAFNENTLSTVDDLLADTFYVNVDPDSYGEFLYTPFRIDPATEAWWATQSPEALAALQDSRLPIYGALWRFYEWCSKRVYSKTAIWARPPSFDVTILESHFGHFRIDCPWNFRQPACVRTLERLHRQLAGRRYDRDPRLVEHRADHDAVHQAWLVQRWLADLSRREVA